MAANAPRMNPPTHSQELRARVAFSMVIAALLPVFAMDLVVLNTDFTSARPGFIEAVVIGSGLAAALLGMALGWIMSGVVVRYAHERVEEAMATHNELARELQVERDRLAYAMEGSRLAMWELEMETGAIQLSANWTALMGGPVSGDTLIPIAELIDRVPPKEQEECWAAVRAVLRGKSDYYDVEHRVRRNDGTLLWIRSRGAVSARAPDGHVLRMTGTNFDVTARKVAEIALQESEAKLQQMALTDSLTGLPNTRLLQDRLERALAQSGRRDGDVAVLFVDLDGFKAVNDAMGHAAGDEVLQAVAERLRACARAADTVARIGGDEFVVLLEGCRSRGDAETVAGKIAAAISAPLALGRGAAEISCSIGIAFHPSDGDCAEILLRNADKAMYRAKEAGKNRFALYAATA